MSTRMGDGNGFDTWPPVNVLRYEFWGAVCVICDNGLSPEMPIIILRVKNLVKVDIRTEYVIQLTDNAGHI